MAESLTLTGLVASPDGSQVLTESLTGPADTAATIGTSVAEALLQNGADRILTSLGISTEQ